MMFYAKMNISSDFKAYQVRFSKRLDEIGDVAHPLLLGVYVCVLYCSMMFCLFGFCSNKVQQFVRSMNVICFGAHS